MKKISKSKIVLLCLSDFSKGIFTGMIANYLIYFFLPTSSSGIEVRISQGYILFGFLTLIGLIKAVGHVIDAFTDPIIANWSDKSKNKRGRRIPFMRCSAIPYGLSAFLIFCPPVQGQHIINDLWVGVFIWLYFIFYTMYMIPHGALFPELITDHKRRLGAYGISAFFFVIGSALVYTAPTFVNIFKNFGISATAGYQITFGILTAIGIALLLATAFSINEKEYSECKIDSTKLLPAIKSAFKNKHFTIITIGWLFEFTSMAFFQAAIMYYVTILLGLPEKDAPLILIISIICSVALYPFVVALSKKIGKKIPLLSALIVFIIAYLIIFFGADWPFPAMAKGILLSVLVSYPFAALNIIPNAMLSDVIHYDTITTGTNKEGIFSAARSFVTKLAQSIAIMIVPSVIAIGKTTNSSVGPLGVKLTAIIAAIFCALSIIAFFLYDDKMITKFIENYKHDEQPPLPEELEIQ
ncbi:MAG: MFS transporter [Spirochaetales bacterium]|nr:MFS transporter [Spirochaetales bacterium]